MRCPFCGAVESKVIDSRLGGDNDQVRRRRECLECVERFTTYETAEVNLPRVIKNRGNREPFSEEKLMSGLQKALEKRPVSVEELDASVARIKHRCLQEGEREIDARQVGEWVMDELRKLDKVAYIRFASVYRSFEDVAAFRDMIERLEKEPSSEDIRNQMSLLDDD